MVDENILINLGIDASQAGKNINDLTAKVDKLKAKIKALATEFNTSFQIAAKALAKQELPQVRALEPGMPIPQAKAEAQGRVQEYQTAMSMALKDLTQDQSLAYSTMQESEKNELNTALAANKQKRDDAVVTAKAETDAEQARAQAAKGIVDAINKTEQEKLALQKQSAELTEKIAAADQKASDLEYQARKRVLEQMQKEKEAKDALAKKAEGTLATGLKPTDMKLAQDQSAIIAKNTADAKARILDLMNTTKMEAPVAAEALRNVYKKENMGDPQAIAANNKAIAGALKEINAEAKASTPQVNTFGAALKNAFAIVGIYSVVQVIRQVIQIIIRDFQELVKAGEDYAQTIYRVGVAVSQLQRRGMDITIKQETTLIKELSAAYGTYSQKSIMEAVASVQLLTRNFGFTQEQIKKTVQLSLDLALVQGKDVSETAKELALFYSSGYGEGLQRAGIAVNRMTVVQEAHRLGMNKSYMQLTELERAAAAYNLVERQSMDLHQDAIKIQDSLIGKIKEQRASITDVTNEIALKALPIELMWLKVKLLFTKEIYNQIQGIEASNDAIDEVAKRYGKSLEKMNWFEQNAFGKEHAEEINKRAKEIIEENKKEFEKILSEGIDVKGNLNVNIDQEHLDALKAAGDKIIKFYDDMKKAEDEFDKNMEKLRQDHNDKMLAIDTEAVDKLSQLWTDYQAKLASIDTDLNKSIAGYQTDYYRKLEDLNKDYQTSIQDSNRKYHDDELKEERDHQERLRHLREQYLYDLVDALRARDAKAILELARRYEFEKKQENENYADKQKQNAIAHQQELADLKRQDAEKRRQALIDLQRQIADAKAAAEQKRKDALAEYTQAVKDEHANADKLRSEENKNYAARKKDLEQQLKERKIEIETAFGEEIAQTNLSLSEVSQLFKDYLGKEGVVPGVIDEYIASISTAADVTSQKITDMQVSLANLIASIDAAEGKLTEFNQRYDAQKNAGATTGNWNWQANQMPGQAQGGMIVANSPTIATFGEAGPEAALFLPLDKINLGQRTPTPVSGSKNATGKMKLEFWLSPDLEAKITDNTLSEVADVLMERLK